MSSKNPHAKQPASLRKRPAAAAMALGLSTAVLVPMVAVAQEQKPAAESALQTVNVIDTALEANPNAEPGVPYKAKYSGDERHKRALAETAQNIQVLTKAQIEALRCIAGGDRHAAAAAKLGISESALKARITSARVRLMARTTAEAIQRAKDYRLI